MRLYTDNNGRWAGTQADAKEFGKFDQVEVPTDKPNLLEFLNENHVSIGGWKYVTVQDQIDRMKTSPAKTHPQSCSANPNVYDVKDAVLNCDRKHLGTALAAIITRLHDEVEAA